MTASAHDLGAGLEAPPGYETDEDEAEEAVESLPSGPFFRMTGIGYEYVSPTSPHDDAGERPVYIHRLAAYAWRIIDGLDDSRHVHHDVPDEWRTETETDAAGVPWLTLEDLLTAERPDEHATYHFAGGRGE